MGAIWKTNYLQMAANFQESAEKTNQEYHLNDLLQQGVLCSSWDLPTSYLNPLLSSSPPPTPTSIGDLSSYFREHKDQHGRTPLTLLPSYRLYLLLWLPNALPFHLSGGLCSAASELRLILPRSSFSFRALDPSNISLCLQLPAASLLALSFLPIYLLTFLQFKQQ